MYQESFDARISVHVCILYYIKFALCYCLLHYEEYCRGHFLFIYV